MAVGDPLAFLGAPGSRRRTVATVAGALVLVAVLLQVLLPKATPNGILVRGLLTGCVNALLATGLVLIWRSARVINFAQASLGGAAAYLCFSLVEYFGVPFLLALPIAVAGGALTGFLVDAVFVQRFFNAPRLVLTVVTIVVARFLGDSRSYVNAIPPIGERARRPRALDALQQGDMKLPFDDFTFEIFPLRFGSGAVITLVLTALALGALAMWLRTSRLGTAVRGVAVNAERAQSLGINVRAVGAVVWTVAGTLSGVAVLLQGIESGFDQSSVYSPEMLMTALAAAVLARMESLPLAVIAAVVISAVTQAVYWSYPTTSLVDLGLLLVIGGGLLAHRKRAGRSEENDSSSWEATKEIRPVPQELSAVSEVRRSRRFLVGAALVLVVVYPFTTSTAQTNLGSLIFIQAIVALSVVVLTGWSGQVSLGQFALVAVAAVIGSNLTAERGITFWIALPLVAALAAGFAALLGLPAMRMRGSFLAVTTLAFAVATERTLFRADFFTGLIPDRVNRPNLLFLSFASERNYYFLCLATLVVAALVVGRLRRSRTGRVLIAARENEAAVQSFGIPLVRTRLAAFAASGALCGVAGMLFVHHQRAVDAGSYSASVSIDMFIMAMVGGIGTMSGALLGAAYVGIITFVIPNAVLRNLATSGGLLVLLFMAPGGLAALVAAARDAALRIVATRRGIVAPSLFEDMDEEAIRNRRAPLVDRIPFRGLEAIPAQRRYVMASELHGRRRRHVSEVAK
jgi:branched-chain amino acid transport system permease protein